MSTLKAMRNLLLPGVMKIFLLCLLAYVAAFAGVVWGVNAAIDSYVDLQGAQGWMAGLLAGAGGAVIAWFLFPLFYPVLISFFDEKMAEIVDAADYPHLPPAQEPFWPTLASDAWFTVKALALNIVCLPLFFIPVAGAVLYYGLNGYLLGVQFFRMSAGRRTTRERADRIQKENFVAIMTAGVAISFFATVPVVNLVAPVLGVATMLHLFYALLARDTARSE